MTIGCRAAIGLIASIVVLLAVPRPAAANMAQPPNWAPPSLVGEPEGDLKAVTIERENLEIDLRPLSNPPKGTYPNMEFEPAQVLAAYRIRNDGQARDLTLLFVADALKGQEGSGVWLDGEPVPISSAAPSHLPDSWQPPKTTPRIGWGPDLPYLAAIQGPPGFVFHVVLPSGHHEIRVRYLAQAAVIAPDSRGRALEHQLGYVLAPAREWAGFGGLDVTVEVPAGWAAATSPPLKRTGDALSGSFNAIPADTLALTAEGPYFGPAPENWDSLLIGILVVAALGLVGVLALVLVPVGLLIWWLRRRRGRHSKDALPAERENPRYGSS